VISHITAAAGADDRNVLRREHMGFFAAAPESVNVRMFYAEKNIWERLLLLARYEILLQLKGGEIIQAAQVSIEKHKST
jgi:hypothetical protein